MSEDGKTIVKRNLVPDMAPDSLIKFPFYRPEPPTTLKRIAELRPGVLYVFGSLSDMSSPESCRYKVDITGTGTGGSGGAKEGMVEGVMLEGIGHLVAMEASEKCADAAAVWLGKEVTRFEKERMEYIEWTKQSFEAKTTFSEEWKRRIGPPPKPIPKSKM
jgi:hypothetical protein